MPYCSKCGVEVDNNVKKCPLCDFQIPDVGQDTEEKQEYTFPEAENIYKKRVESIKNKIFFTLIMLLFFTIPILISIKVIYPFVEFGINYAIVSVLASIFYLYFIFGYLRTSYNILGIGAISIIFTYILDSMDNNMSWFYEYAFIIILLAMIVSYVYILLYKNSKNKNKWVYVPTYIVSAISVFSLGIDLLIYYRNYGKVKLTWSVIIFICSIAICFLLLSLYHKLPEKARNKIKRKLHV